MTIVFGAFLTARCGGSPIAPSAPVVDGPTLSCPAPQTLQAGAGQAATLTYVTPAGSGGTGAVTVACTPPSGTSVSVGESQVTCTATDAAQRSQSCLFAVTVTPRPSSPRLALTRILAFGDSITSGVNGDTGGLTPAPYPATLQTMLANRYYDQTIIVVNAGLGGEHVSDGISRLQGLLTSVNPQAVLLMEGANDLNAAFITGQNRLALPAIADGLRDMIKLVRQSGAEVLIATVTPQRRNSPKGAGADLVSSLNDLIYWSADRESAPVVDVWQAFGGNADLYIGADGLHPNTAGYQQLAETFFGAVRARLEVAPVLQLLTRWR